MTRRHAAALGLLIWYFMVPPAPNYQFTENAIGRFINGDREYATEPPPWVTKRAFETQPECRAFQWIYQQRFGEPGAATFAGECVESRNPLAPNITAPRLEAK
jgi:hypothetical protein